jgi:tRNA(Ile)-lysidine synthetase-like protein
MIYGYLRENGIAWRDDSSNKDNKYLRNFTRNQLLPDIRVHFKNSGNALLSLSRTSYEYTSLIDDLLTEKYKILFKIKDDVVIIKSDRFIRDKRIFKYIIAKAIRENFKLNVSYGMLEEIYKNAIIEKSHLNLFANNRINIKKTILNGETVVIVSKGGPDRQNSNEWEYTLDIKSIDNTVLKIGETGKNIQVSVVGYQFFTENFKNKKYIFIEINDNNQNFIIRNRRSGDKIKLKSGTKKIKNLFIDAKLNAGTKDIIPIFMVDAKIAAIMTGFIDNSLKNRVSSDFYVSDKSKKILAIQRI